MKILTKWLRAYLPELTVDDNRLAEDLTLRGIAVDGIYPLGGGNGSFYEMDITTNRVDAMNHHGVAREVAAIYGLDIEPLDFALPAARPAPNPFSVRIEAEDACGRFTARVLRDVTIDESRDWFVGAEVATYFGLLEQKMISNAVDATNFAWLAMGQPTHAFDLDKIEGGIIVRRARKGERLKTLDGMDRVLDAEDLVVADHKKALALAGVMGGWDSMITAETKNVLIEAAWFEPTVVRQTARRHGLHTDASHRFERGADFNAASVASALVSAILLANGGWIDGEFVDVRVTAMEERTARRRPVLLKLSEVRRILGATVNEEGITAATVEGVLTALGCGLASQSAAADQSAGQLSALAAARLAFEEVSWLVTLPSWRLDLEREIDLIEEIARVYGYNRFANTLPAFGEGVTALPWAEKEASVRGVLRGAGFHEAISSTFCSAAEGASTAAQPGQVVRLGNPLSEEAGVLRPSLAPGMLAMIAGNLNRDVNDVRLFELGTVFSGTTEKVDERPSLAFGAVGNFPDESALHAGRAIDFYDLKGAVEQVLLRFEVRTVYFDRFPPEAGLMPEWLHPYRAARVAAEGVTLGWFGEVHPRLAAARKLKERVLLGELFLDRLYRLPLRQQSAREISRFQPVRRDFSLVLDESVGWETIDRAMAGLRIPELVEWQVREVFRETRLGSGEYALLLRTTFQASDRTLREEELQAFHACVVEAVGKVGARLRS